MKQLTLTVPGELTATGMALAPGKLTYDKWASIGTKLREMNTASRWWLGDWVIYGERYLAETYTQALEDTDYDKETVRGFAYVCERFEPERRRDDVSWSHHRVVAALPPKEADRWLKLAAKNNWTVKELKKEIRKAKAEDVEEPEEGKPVIIVKKIDGDIRPREWLLQMPGTWFVVAALGDSRFILARKTDEFDPENIEVDSVGEFIVTALTKELGV